MSTGSTKSVALALQGGGTHGAFAWGAVDQLLLDGRLRVEAISATSGGAMTAVVLAQGLLEGGEEKARERMQQFWRKVSIASSLLPLRTQIVDKLLSNVGIDFSPTSLALDYLTRIFSPYQFNLFDINPLRSIVEELVDFEALRKKSPVRLFVNATHVKSGKSKVFTEKNLSLDVIMASACLPFVFKTVDINGEPFWDGSYSGSPALAPLVNECSGCDIVLVQVHPLHVDEAPTQAADILDRVTEISFNNALIQEVKAIDRLNRLIAAGTINQQPVRLHRIEAQDLIAGLGRASKLNADWDFLVYLHDLGAQASADWLSQHADAVGKTSSVDIAATY